MNNLNLIEVYLADNKVGRMALLPDGACAFEYYAEWLSSGFSISPFFLPLKSGLITAKRDPFRGGFGVFDDSLPDGWGNLLLDRFLQEQGVDPYKLNVLERLSLIGSTGRGALEYRHSDVSRWHQLGLLKTNILQPNALTERQMERFIRLVSQGF